MQKIDPSDLLALTAIVFSVLAGTCSTAGGQTVADHMEQGDSYYSSGNYQAALEEFKAAKIIVFKKKSKKQYKRKQSPVTYEGGYILIEKPHRPQRKNVYHRRK